MSQDCNLIKLKRGLSTEWTDLNPVLKLGEPGYEKDTKKLKIGDGVTLWNDLPYIGSGTIDFEDVQDEVANLLKAGNNIVLDYNDDDNILTISTSGLQPSGNYATLVNGLVPEGQLPSYVDDVLEFNNLASFPSPGESGKIYVALDSSKVYRWSGSTYIEISSGPSSTDSVPEGTGNLYYTKDRINDLLQAGSNISLIYDNTNLTISATGLQPSGNYSVEGHSHVSSDITDFNSSVSGLIPIQNLTAVSGIQISSSGTSREISSNFIAGNGIAFNYNNDESLLISTITNDGIIPITNNSTTTLSIPNGYVVASLSIYQNGVKLLDGIDYTATNGSDVILTNIPSSGSYIEYSTPTVNNNIQGLIDSSVSSVYDTVIYDLGSVSGNVNVDYAIDKQIQKLTIDGSPLTLNKGSGWPTGNISRDVMLQINCISSTTIIWNIVGSNWYDKPTSILPGGEYLVLLRAMDNNVIQGHYIGEKQGSL